MQAHSTLNLTEVLWSYEPSHVYLGSPSVLRVPDGSLLLTADRFGAGFAGQPRNVSVHRSVDEGQTWRQTGWVRSQYWSNLFSLSEGSSTVYLLGTASDGPSPLKIARSDDAGASWPVELSAILHGETRGNASYETGPTPSLIAGNRVYRAVERLRPPFTWGVDYEAVTIHADVTADLLHPSSWSVTPPLPFDPRWIPKSWQVKPAAPGYLEGNMVEGPDGHIYNMHRCP